MKRVLITGGSRGIGAACVEKFKKKNCDVVFIYKSNTTAAASLAAATNAIAIQADITDAEQAEKAVGKAIDIMGGIDVLVNSAGISQIKLFTDITNEDWKSVIDTDLTATFLITRAAAKYMISQKYGKIVNIGSMWGKTGASCEVHYSAAKAGIEGMTKALSKELGLSGITVNCVEPGVINTDMNAAFDENTKNSLAENTPLGRLGEAYEVAEAVYFLASDRASFITGQIIGVDGGFAV